MTACDLRCDRDDPESKFWDNCSTCPGRDKGKPFPGEAAESRRMIRDRVKLFFDHGVITKDLSLDEIVKAHGLYSKETVLVYLGNGPEKAYPYFSNKLPSNEFRFNDEDCMSFR